jgi:hypothetical protein
MARTRRKNGSDPILELQVKKNPPQRNFSWRKQTPIAIFPAGSVATSLRQGEVAVVEGKQPHIAGCAVVHRA